MYYYSKNMSAGTYSVNALNAIMHNGVLLYVSYFDRSRTLCRAVAGCIDNGYTVKFDRRTSADTSKQKYARVMNVVPFGRDRFNLFTIINKDIGKRYLLTDAQHLDEDFFNFLMTNYKLPLLEEWTESLRRELIAERLVSIVEGWRTRFEAYLGQGTDIPGIDIHGQEVGVNDVLVYDFELLKEDGLSAVVTQLIERGDIKVSDVESEPLVFSDMDSYIRTYGETLVRNLDQTIETLSPLKGELDGFAAKTKRMYPQQAACVNGIIALKRAGSRYGLMVEGMGCGKTLQGAAVVDSYFNQEWLNKHPGKTLRDMWQEDGPKYRNVLMAPSHLILKWKEEILSEIPGTSVTVVKSVDQLLELRSEGRDRKGKEWYLLSKDFAKLGEQRSPIPSQTATQKAHGLICKDCAVEGETVWISARGKACSRCGGKNYEKRELSYGKLYGLTCPQCGELLLQNGKKYYDSDDPKAITLKPKDFSGHKASNEVCVLCGTHLWGANAKPLVSPGLKSMAPKSRWYKVSHWKNYQRKNRSVAFVLKGHENEYYQAAGVELDGIKESKIEYGPRRVSPALFIKKYLKGYFDFCVLDECHKYENGGTAQANAAHALMKASDFTLGLTGTISNGKADSFFYLLYMLDPRRMRKFGFEYKDVMEFSRIYGAIETTYEISETTDGVRNSQSRGRQLQSPRVKPGISPKLFTDFLIDKSVFLDLSDLSKYMPPLKEKVVTCKLPDEVMHSYKGTIDTLNEASRGKGGRSLLSTSLQFGLSYPDKPYGFKPIMHPQIKDNLVCRVPSHDEYMDVSGVLLPKEEKLVEIVQAEIAEDRNCFIYCANTGKEEMNITGRLKAIVEKRCNLYGQVLVMEAASPKATEREAFIKQKATEGIRVFICNMKLVETGLDFCFKVGGVDYNYPSIIFYQMTYELAVMWQASRRHYRLNQRQECRTFYMCYENTLQAAAVQIMAEKQVAASAIQGKFSADGLAAMANGVDPRVKLAQMLAANDTSDRESLESMFDVMNQSNESEEDSKYSGYEPPKTYYEIMEGIDTDKGTTEVTAVDIMTTITKIVAAQAEEPKKPAVKKPVRTATMNGQVSLLSLVDIFKPVVVNDAPEVTIKAKKKKSSNIKGQVSILSLVA